MDYTIAYLKKLKKSPFSTPIKAKVYEQYVDELKAKPVIFLRGSNDLVAHKAGSTMPQNSSWKVIGFDGGHMQGPYVMKDTLFKIIAARM